MTASDVPIVCTLRPNEVAGRLQEYEALFGEHLRAIEHQPRRLRLLLHPAAGWRQPSGTCSLVSRSAARS